MLQSGPVLAVGTMSGTSLDGVDVAAVVTDGETITTFGRTAYRAYGADEQAALHAVRGRWQGDSGVDAAARIVEDAHAQVLAGFTDADVVGFHGQTLAHDPAKGRTHQAGSGDALARALGKTVVWDFRTADVARGGEGAPLAPFFHFACAKWAGLNRPVAFLNLGGVGNITWVDPRFDAPRNEALLAFDTGPANAPLNDLLLARRGLARDEGGVLSASGTADEGVVRTFLQSSYFHRQPPKSLDRDTFDLQSAVAHMGDADAAATLTACCAAAVAAGLDHMPVAPTAIYVCGGGRKNAAMMRAIAERCGVAVHPVETIGLDGDMLEAQAFAWLAVRVMRGLPTSGPTTTGVAEPVCGGKISTP